jgi:hypothetical protein
MRQAYVSKPLSAVTPQLAVHFCQRKNQFFFSGVEKCDIATWCQPKVEAFPAMRVAQWTFFITFTHKAEQNIQ